MKGQLRGYLQKNAIVNFGFYENWPLSRLDIIDLALHFTSAELFQDVLLNFNSEAVGMNS